jgi:glycerophosphoryl diester phosphodiesterase
MAHPFFDVATPIAIGHRGCAGEAPENTLASFRRGIADGAAILETDAHLSADGVPVLIHDGAVERVTDGHGRVSELDLAALQRLDAGYRFSPDGGRSHPQRGSGLRIPTLREALEALPGVRFNIELKDDRPGLVERVVEAVAEAGRAALTLLTAADDALMARLREHVAREGVDVALGACTHEVAAFALAAARGETPPDGPMALQIPPEFAGRPLVTPALLECAHRHGVQVHVWTVNDPGEIAALLDLGVDGIVSDFPARVASMVKSRR